MIKLSAAEQKSPVLTHAPLGNPPSSHTAAPSLLTGQPAGVASRVNDAFSPAAGGIPREAKWLWHAAL